MQRRRNRPKRRQRSSLLFGGQNSFKSIPHYRFTTRMIWRKGWIEERTLCRMDASRQTTPHHPPPKMDVLTKTLLQIIHAAGYSAAFKYVTPNSSDDLCLLFCLFLLVWNYITINSAIYKKKCSVHWARLAKGSQCMYCTTADDACTAAALSSSISTAGGLSGEGGHQTRVQQPSQVAL